MQISWKHDHTYLDKPATVEKRIDVFEAMMFGWQLDIADLMLNGGRDHEDTKDVPSIPHAAFAAMQVVLVYFETIAKFIDGNTGGKESADLFKKGFLDVFSEAATSPYQATNAFLNLLYSNARCGLYHLSMTGAGIVLSSTGIPVQFSSNPTEVIIDPHTLIKRVKMHFADYVAKLRDTNQTELRTNFQKCFEYARKTGKI